MHVKDGLCCCLIVNRGETAIIIDTLPLLKFNINFGLPNENVSYWEIKNELITQGMVIKIESFKSRKQDMNICKIFFAEKL